MNTRANNPMKLPALLLLATISLPAAAIDLVSLDGKQESVQSVQINNMWTLVMLWSLDCVACEEQKPMIDSFHRDHRNSNAQVVVVATDGDSYKQQVTKFLSKSNYSFDNYLAKTNVFASQYSQETRDVFKGTPTYLLYGPDGALAGVHAGILQRAQLEKIVGPAEKLTNPSVDLMQ